MLRCAACNAAMGHAFSKSGNPTVPILRLQAGPEEGLDTCPSPSLSAGEIERFVVDQIKAVGRDPGVIRDTWPRCGASRGPQSNA